MLRQLVFVRFVIPDQSVEGSTAARGLVGVAYDLANGSEVDAARRTRIGELLEWLEEHLSVPERFGRTSSKGWYRRNHHGLSWVRLSAEQHLDVLRKLANIVREAGLTVVELETERAGFVIYEDDHQVVAEPFRDTPIR
jgi:hypothetical protein